MSNSETAADALARLIAAITLVHARLNETVEALHAGSRLTPALRGVLLCLDQNGPQTISRLADICAVSRQFLQRTVTALMAGGWVETRPNPRHRRSPFIALTSQGTAEVARVRAAEAPLLRQVAAGFETADLDVAIKVLRALGEAVHTGA